MSTTYSDKLRDPRWQKRRLEVFERAGWKCQCCGESKETLHVHHLVYGAGEPWEASLESLESLCETCHGWREGFNEHWGRCEVPTVFCMDFEMIFEPLFNGEAKSWSLRRNGSGRRALLFEYRNYKGLIERKFLQPEDGSDYSI